MNAYELADRLFKANFKESANMIIQQADRIAELEKQLQGYQTATKHYREKAQIKDLSDEELWEIWDARIFTNPVGFYRTAIKKASEK